MRHLLSSCGCVWVCLVAGSAAADTIPRRLADYRFANDAWDIRPAYEPATGLVSGIVAVAKLDAVIGDNLSVVMFVRGVNNQWSAWSWATATRAEGVMSAKYVLNIPDEDDPKWEIDEPIALFNGEDWLIPPSPYMAGMLTDDPLFEPVMNSTNPAALVSMLADLGYPVATAGRPLDGGGESDQVCIEGIDEKRMLSAMASGVEWGMTQSIADDETVGATVDTIAAWLPKCWPITPCTPGATGPAAMGPIVVQACNTIFDHMSMTAQGAGYTVWCFYIERQFYTQTRSQPWVDSNCVASTCRQIRTGSVSQTFSCTSGWNMADPPPSCPPQPACSSGTPSICGNPNGLPINWQQWAPPCPDEL